MTNITFTNAKGFFTADAEVLSRAIEAVGSASLTFVRNEAALACGFNPNWVTGLAHDFDDFTRVEALIAWIDSGNHSF